MFKRDLFQITDEDPTGPRELSETVTGDPAGQPPAPSQGERDGNAPEAAQASGAPLQRWPDRHLTAALIVGSVALLLSMVAMTGRPVESPSADDALAPPSADGHQKNVQRRGKTARSLVRAPAKRPGPATADGHLVGRSPRPARSEPVPLQPAAPLVSPAPRSTTLAPIAPPRADPPRAGEFDFEVGYR
jgi:hypothetical protein